MIDRSDADYTEDNRLLGVARVAGGYKRRYKIALISTIVLAVGLITTIILFVTVKIL